MPKKRILFEKNGFQDWKSLNDTIMGGKSVAICENTNAGLLFKGNICLLYTSPSPRDT